MFELFKKSLLAGIGAVVVTKEKVQEATRRFVEEGKLSSEEAERMADDLIRSGERQWEELSSRFFSQNKKWWDNPNVVKREEFQELKARVEMLNQRLAVMENNQRRSDTTVAGEY